MYPNKGGYIQMTYKTLTYSKLNYIYKATMKISLFLFEKVFKGKIYGLENLNTFDSYILAMNHASYLDWLIVYSYFYKHQKIKIRFLAKEKLFKNPFWKTLMLSANCIKVPDNFNYSEFKDLRSKIIEDNVVIGIFPEGTRSHNGKIQEAHPGIVNIIKLTDKPVIPVALIGFYDLWPRSSLLPKLIKSYKSNPIINIGKPIINDPGITISRKEESTLKIMTAIANLQSVNNG
jgi:1-acyl-sn-glycerol-3-phosphate acyltransferase